MRQHAAQFAFRTVLALSISAGLAGYLPSQTQPALPSAKNQIRVATNEVIVPVTVTDASGAAVSTGLPGR